MRAANSLFDDDRLDELDDGRDQDDRARDGASFVRSLSAFGFTGDRVRDAVQRALTARQREAVELHFFEGLSQSEVARRLGITQQVVHKSIYGVDRRGKRIGGALARLRRALAQGV
jgi:DNA-directed RNA polymerase specialized sigma24 family protein